MTGKMTRRTCIGAIAAAPLPRSGRAEQPVLTIGVLDASAATAAKLSAFHEGLKIEGFIGNQNVTIQYHSAEGDYARLPALAADLLNRQVNLISALGTPAALAAKNATSKIPIVFAIGPNPTEIGLVTSLDHPGANMTGVTGMAAGRERKRLELLHTAIPTAPVLAILLNPGNSRSDFQVKDALAAAKSIDLQLAVIRASSGHGFDDAFADLAQSRAHGVVIADDDLFLSASAELASLAARHRTPAIFEGAAFASAGGLMSYGSRFVELYHQAGVYSGLVLGGAAPAQLPVYQSVGIDMIVNLRSASALGIALPQTIIEQASSVIR
jgi:putative tryptophan/tyrosine transport system substrate-binding protein